MLDEGYGSLEKIPRWKKVLVGKKIARKEMPMTINERRWRWTSAREVITHLSTAYLAYLPKHRGVRVETYVEYVQSTCSVRAKWERGYGRRSPGGGGGYNMVHQRMFSRWKKVLVGIKNGQKEMSITINERRWRWTRMSEVLIYPSTAHLLDFPKHLGVCAETYVEYVQSTCSVHAKWERGYRTRSPRGWGGL